MLDDENAIAPDAQPSVTQSFGKLSVNIRAFNHDEVVSEALIFAEFHALTHFR